MIIDLLQLRQRGKESESFTFTYQLPEGLSSIPDSAFIGPAEIDCLVEVYPDEAFISGKCRYQLAGPCSRCLEDTVYQGEVSFDERFLPAARQGEADCDLFVYERDRINLTRFIDELILTDMPLSLLCNEDCKGLCHDCGQNLNKGDCGHHRRNND